MKKIHYIAYYGNIKDSRNLYLTPSGISKMSYVISSLKKAGYEVNVFSTAYTKNKYKCHYKKRTDRIDKGEKVTYIDTFGSEKKLVRGMAILWMYLQLIIYLLFEVSKGEKVIFYHSNSYVYPVKVIKVLRRIHLIFEVEELYTAAAMKNEIAQKKEIKYLNIADSYILVNDIIAERCGLNSKPHIVLYGNYTLPKLKPESISSNELVNVVYAGFIGKEDSDAFLAVESVNFLNEKYIMNILGYGSNENIQLINKKINQVNKLLNRKAVIFHGSLYGQEYSDFLAKMQIGVSPRVLENDLSNFTFPSKVLVYLAHNLVPVCSPIDCIKKSKIVSSIYFYNNNTPSSVAEGILSVNLNENHDYSVILRKLDTEFIKDLKKLLAI